MKKDCQPTKIETAEQTQQLSSPNILTFYIMNETKDLTLGTATIAYTNDEIVDCDTTFFTDHVTQENLPIITGHETGHCLGLPHSTNKDALMFSAPALPRKDIEDMARMYTLYGLCNKVLADDRLNLFIPRAVKFDDQEDIYQAFVRTNPLRYEDVQLTECIQ